MRATLARLLAEPLGHVIVVENGSSDGTREWLASDVTRTGGQIRLTLILPHGTDAPAARRRR